MSEPTRIPAGGEKREGFATPERAMRNMLHAIRDLDSSRDLSEGLKRVAETVKRSIRYDTFAVLLLDEMGSELRFVHAEGFPDEVVEHWRFGIGQGIVGTAAESRETLNVPDVRVESRYISAADEVGSEIALPLLVKDRVIGVLDVGSKQPGFFSDGDVELLELLADHLAGAIEMVRIHQNMREQASSLSLLHEMSREMTSILNRRQLLRKVAERLRQIIDYDVFSVMLWDEGKQVLEPWFSVYRDGRKVDWAGPVRLGEGICGTAAALRQPVRVTNVDLDPRYVACPSEIRVRSELVVPLLFKDRLIGVLDLESSKYNAFSNRHQQLLSTMGSSLAIALENARLYEKLRHDEQRLEKDLSTAREVQKQLLPKQTPWLQGVQLGVAYQPARHLGGDFYDFLPYGDRCLAVAVGDVAGKATSAALLGSLAVGTLREFAARSHLPPGRILAAMNDKLGRLGFSSRFVAMVFAVYDAESRVLTIANSGLPYPYLVRGRTVRRIEVAGVPLGLLPDRKYEEVEIELQPGDAVVIASDGVEESLNTSEEEFSFARARGTLERLADRSASQIADGLLDAVRAFSDGAEISDDRTILTLKVD
ncbi:MAG: SpoIIE family protein phosphatase [Acidobacteria bacterium]|nr:SpoIIE family protein phosphatase [Acidobacteriota bacterium]